MKPACKNSRQNSDVRRVVNRVIALSLHVVNLSNRRRAVANFLDVIGHNNFVQRIHVKFVMSLKSVINVINFFVSFLIVVEIFGINQMFISDNV